MDSSPRARILISGASGLIGKTLVPALREADYAVIRLIREARPAASDSIGWDPDHGRLDSASLDGVAAAIHLGGVNLTERRWTARFKTLLRDSRVKSTELLCRGLAQTRVPPRLLICASAVGYYGDRGAEMLDEDSPPGDGFLADLCRDWEAAADPARQAGIRVAHLRLGVVLTRRGGLLPKLLPFFGKGLGGVLGNGRQYLSWITMHDLIRVFSFVLGHPGISGPLNCVSAEPVTNRELTRTLVNQLHRPAILSVPSFAIRLLLGEMGRALLLAGQRAQPTRLTQAGFHFEHPTLAEGLRHELGIVSDARDSA